MLFETEIKAYKFIAELEYNGWKKNITLSASLSNIHLPVETHMEYWASPLLEELVPQVP